MKFSDKYKALCITFLISGTIVLAMFNLHIRQHETRIAETFYDIQPEKEISQKEILERLEQQLKEEQVKAETNTAFNQNQKNQRFAQAYQRIAPPEDYVRPDLNTIEDGLYANKKIPTESSRIEKEDRNSFSKVNEILNKQLEDDLNNAKSTMIYSLVNRKHQFLPTPIYLCETSGKIVINITVNASGKVISTNYNNASSSGNQCLIEHALEYAKKARFNTDASKASQIGTITFYFQGKP
ncbi:energy transducer TonB [Oceanihabitans sp.]|jgi:TonB family protein|nr:energy transducer TonB [Oceanihabitans sp.]